MNKNSFNYDISFITINYNSSEFTNKLIESIVNHTSKDVKYEIIIVDNASKKEDLNNLNLIDNVKLVKNKINNGFAGGNMLGVNYASAEYFFFINNDTLLLNDAGVIMKKYLDENKDISLATAKVNDEKGNFSSSYKLFPSLSKELLGNTVSRKLNKNKFPSNKIKLEQPTYVDVVSGSCMFFRASEFCKIGGFDTVFFLYCEEEDISKRIWDSDGKVIFLPDAEIFHSSGGSTKVSFDITKEFYISYKHLIFKHFNIVESYLLIFLMLFKLFRRIIKRKNGLKLFLFGLSGFSKKSSIRYNQKIIDTCI